MFFFFFGGGGGGWAAFTLNLLWDYFVLRIFFLLSFFSVLWWRFINICLTFTHSFTQFFSCIVGMCKCQTVCFFLFLGINIQVVNCFWKNLVSLKRAWLVQLVRANPLIWADSAGWTDWEVVTVHDE